MVSIPQAHLIVRFAASASPVLIVGCSSDGQFLVTSPDECHVDLWESDTVDLLQTFAAPVAMQSVAFSDDGAFFAASLLDGKILVWRRDGIPLLTLNAGVKTEILFLPATSLLAFVSSDYCIEIWDLHSLTRRCISASTYQKKKQTFLFPDDVCFKMVCSSDGSQIAVYAPTRQGEIPLWQCRFTPLQVHLSPLHSVQGVKDVPWNILYRPSTHHLLFIDRFKRRILGYDTDTTQRLPPIAYPDALPDTFCFSPQGDFVAVADCEGKIAIWDFRRATYVLVFDVFGERKIVDDCPIRGVCWLPERNVLAIGSETYVQGMGEACVTLWQLNL